MTKAVFTTKLNPTYDDLPEGRYHFPRTYLKAVERTVGDHIIYYEPRRTSGQLSSRGGRQAYFATALVTGVRDDPSRPDHFYADIADFQEFYQPVHFKAGSHYYESALRRADGGTSKGAFGRAVRLLPEEEFDLILQSGYAVLLHQPSEIPNSSDIPGFAEEPETFDRPIVEVVSQKKVRDATFAHRVKAAYADTCALTGIRLINGGGLAEVQAAHIRPVADSGPDSTRNGIALSGTAHWMFDRGLISVADDYRILMAKDQVPDNVARVFNPDGMLHTPPTANLWPHPQFLRYHRERFGARYDYRPLSP